MTFTHPETGELLSTKEEFKVALASIEEQMAPLYRVRARIREAAAEAFDPPDMPQRRYRTPRQDLITRCPRCGGRIESEGAAQK